MQLPEESVLSIQSLHELHVRALAEHDGMVAPPAGGNLSLDRAGYERRDGARELGLIVVVQIRAATREPEWRDRREKEALVERTRAAVALDEIVNEDRRQLTAAREIVGDPARIREGDGIGECHSRDTRAESARIDTKDEDARLVVVEEGVQERSDIARDADVRVRIHHGDAGRHPRCDETAIESHDPRTERRGPHSYSAVEEASNFGVAGWDGRIAVIDVRAVR